MKRFFLSLIGLYISVAGHLVAQGRDNDVITFNEAVERVLTYSPKLKIFSANIGEKLGNEWQSRLFPNPIFSYSVENVLGTNNWEGWEAAESRYEVAQLVELGQKRVYRAGFAHYQLYASLAGYGAGQLSVLNRLLKAFVEVAGAQEQLKIAAEQFQISEKAFKTVEAKVEAGKVSLIQQNKAEIALLTSKIAVEKANADFYKAREKLSLIWGKSCPDFGFVDFPFYQIDSPVCFDTCLATISGNPELLKSQFEYLSAHQNLHLERAGAIPDLTLSIGLKTSKESNDKGLTLGASFPIPVNNWNQGNIQKARFETERMKTQYDELMLILKNKLSLAHKELLRAYSEAEQLRTRVLKIAIQSFEFAQEGYKEGKFEYLDMLDSQRTLFEVKERYVQALLNYHKSKADIEYLNSLDEQS